MNEIRLTERKQRILRALVDTYIIGAVPISSGEIKEKYLPEVSSATIRSELITLEEMGFLVQPHVSAGRIPSTKAYRYYVDNVLTQEPNDVGLEELRKHFNSKLSEVEQVLQDTAKVISDLTNYTSVVVFGGVSDVLLKEVKLVDIGEDSALVIIITDRGIIKDRIIDLPKGLKTNYFIAANEMLNDMFGNKRLGDIVASNGVIEDEISEFQSLFDEVLSMLNQYRESNEGKVLLEGTDKIFSHKEYENVDNIKNFLSVINTKERLNELVAVDDIEISVKIGRDDAVHDNMAVVSAKCVIEGKEVAHAAVIGPERMDYKKVISVLHNIVSIIEDKE